MDAVVKANSTIPFEINVAGLDERESGRPLFAACETKKNGQLLGVLKLISFALFSFLCLSYHHERELPVPVLRPTSQLPLSTRSLVSNTADFSLMTERAK